MNARETMIALMGGAILRSEVNGLRYRLTEKGVIEVEIPSVGWRESFHGCINHMRRAVE